MTNALIVSFVCGCIGLMALALGFFVQRWVTLLDASLEKINATLAGALAELRETREELLGMVADHDRKLDSHDERIKLLYENKHTPEDCPYIDKKGVFRVG